MVDEDENCFCSTPAIRTGSRDRLQCNARPRKKEEEGEAFVALMGYGLEANFFHSTYLLLPERRRDPVVGRGGPGIVEVGRGRPVAVAVASSGPHDDGGALAEGHGCWFKSSSRRLHACKGEREREKFKDGRRNTMMSFLFVRRGHCGARKHDSC